MREEDCLRHNSTNLDLSNQKDRTPAEIGESVEEGGLGGKSKGPDFRYCCGPVMPAIVSRVLLSKRQCSKLSFHPLVSLVYTSKPAIVSFTQKLHPT